MQSQSRVVPALPGPPVAGAAGFLLVLVLIGVSLHQALDSRSELSTAILRGGRVVLWSGAPAFTASTAGASGPEQALDGDPNTAALLAFPGSHPQGVFILSDLALTHFPGPEGDPDAPLLSRRALQLRIFNGICRDCPAPDFQRFGRIKRARLEILYRRANDPDVEFKIPDARVVHTRSLDFPDHSGPVTLALDLPDPAPSPAYPRNVFYIICKLTVLETYPGRKAPASVSVAEIEYLDTDAQAALQGAGRPFIWK